MELPAPAGFFMILCVTRARIPVAWLCVALATTAVHAQETFTLEGDTWTMQARPDPGTPEGELQAIRELIARGDGDAAAKAAVQWQEQHPNHPARVEALLLEGDAQVTRGSYYKALFPYEAVIRQYPGTEHYRTALERELNIAVLFTKGWKRAYLGVPLLPNHGEAEELYIRVQERAPGTDIGERASILLGDHYFLLGQMRQAVDAYDLFLQNYPASLQREWAMLRLIQANLATFKGPQFSATGLIDAAQRIKDYRRDYPIAAERIGTDALLVRIDESLALKDYHVGRWYEQVNKPISAATMYQRLVRDYPQTGAAERAIDRLTVIGEPTVSSVAGAIPAEARPLTTPQTPSSRPGDALPTDVDAAIDRQRSDDTPRDPTLPPPPVREDR